MIQKKDYINYKENKKKNNSLFSKTNYNFSVIVSLIMIILSVSMLLVFIVIVYAIINSNYQNKISDSYIKNEQLLYNNLNSKVEQKINNYEILTKENENIKSPIIHNDTVSSFNIKKTDHYNDTSSKENIVLNESSNDKIKLGSKFLEKEKLEYSDQFLFFFECEFFNDTNSAELFKAKLALNGIESKIYKKNKLKVIGEYNLNSIDLNYILQQIKNMNIANCILKMKKG